MKRLVVLVAGFGTPLFINRGIVGLAKKLQKATKGTNTQVKLYKWNSVPEIVNEILRSDAEELILVGHSYGASTIAFVAKHINPRIIKHFIATDAVWREKEDKPTLKSFGESWEIDLPRNIENLYCFFQNKGWLTGHDFLTKETTSVKLREHVNGVRHIPMGNYAPFLELVENLTLDKQ